MNEAYRNEFYYITSKQWNSLLVTFIIITFIYTAQIQLYSFQMCLTIKDLKIYPKKKKNKYSIKLQHYIRKGLFKKVSLQITFKNLKIGGASKI